MRKINIISSFFWPVSGDTEDYPYNIAKIVKESGNELEVLTTNVWPNGKKINNKEEETWKGMKIKRFPCYLNITWFVKLWFPKFDNPDIIHCCGGFRHPHFFWSFLKRGKAKFLVSPFYPLHPKKNFIQKLFVNLTDLTINRYIIKKADYCFAETEKEKEWLKSLGAKKIEILPNSLPEIAYVAGNGERFRKKHKITGKILFSLGRQVPIKNFEEIVRALKNIDATLVIGGEQTDYTQKVKAFAKEEGLDKKVIFVGSLNSEQKRDAFTACDVFILSSIRESLGTVVLEAMAQKKPVIATRTGGLPEVVPDDFCLYTQGNADELRDKILKVLSDRKLADELSRKGFAKSKKFSFSIMKKKYLGVIKKC